MITLSHDEFFGINQSAVSANQSPNTQKMEPDIQLQVSTYNAKFIHYIAIPLKQLLHAMRISIYFSDCKPRIYLSQN